MKRRGLFNSLIFILIFSFIISACNLQKDVNVESVAIMEETIPDYIIAGKFDEAKIKSLITYEDGTTEEVYVNSALLNDAYQEELNTPGEYEIEFLLKGKTVKFKIKIIDATLVHEVRFFNGNNDLLSLQLVLDGESAIEPVDQSYLMKGYEFIGWDRKFDVVTEDINVYGLYVKVDDVKIPDNVSFENILLNSVTKMKEKDVNALTIYNLISKRIEETYYHSNSNLEKIIGKTITKDSVYYTKHYKESSSLAVFSYFMEYFDENEELTRSSITEAQFNYLDLYAFAKRLVTSTDIFTYETMLLNDKEVYKLTATFINNSDVDSTIEDYEFIFDNNQIISLNLYQSFSSSSSLPTKELIYSTYYSVDIDDTEKITFPSQMDDEEDVTEIIANKFASGTITTQYTVLETEHFIFQIDKNVYVPGYLEEYIEVIYDTLETVSGLKFYNEHYNPGKIIVEVEKINNENSPETEHAGAYAYTGNARIHISSGDLLIGNSYALTHELSHTLMYSQSTWYHNQIYSEGFAEYTSYKAIKYLELHNPTVAHILEDTRSHVGNMYIHGNIYSKTIEYWIEHTSEATDISFNGAYSIGFRFMSYLDSVYKDYSEWIHYYENINPYHTNSHVNQQIQYVYQYASMTNTYDNAVLDNFYTWLKLHEDLFEYPYPGDGPAYDMTSIKYAYIYPYFYYSGHTIEMTKYHIFTYNNLYLSIDETRNYLQNYKGKNVSNLRLKLEREVMVELYDKNDNLIDSRIDDEFSLVGVSYIKLVGENTLGSSSIQGLQILY